MSTETDMIPNLRLAPHIRYREVGGEGIILDQRAADLIVVNSLGERVLKLLQGNSSFEEMISVLLNEYDVMDDVLKTDVQEYLSQLESAGVIEKIDE